MDGCSAPSTFLTDSLELELGTEWCKPPCFSCAFDSKGEGKFSGESYLASGALKRLILNLDPLPTNFEEDTVEIFGILWVTETALVNSCRELFHLFRQQLYKLESLLQINCDFGKISTLHFKADNIRQQCVIFLHYVKVFIFRCLKVQDAESRDSRVHPYEALEAQLPSVLVDELRGLLFYTGRLSELPSVTVGAFVNQNQIKLFPPSWHLLHLHLDIHWLVLEVLHVLSEKLKQVVYSHQFISPAGDILTNVSLFEEHCENLFCDLISLSLNRYGKVIPSEALMVHHCPCSCVKELWVLLIHLLDHRSKLSVAQSFWNWLNKILKPLFEKSSDRGRPAVPVMQARDPLGFSWWISTHTASFYQFDRHGVPDEMRQMESNWNFVEELLKQSISVQDDVLEEDLRMYLHCCLTLCDFWEPNISIVTILWEYYSKNLNSSFSISRLPLKGFTNTKSPLSMLEVVKTCCCDKQDPDLYKSGNSYIIFLCILAKVVKKAMKSSGLHPWKQVKGRIYSKFHQKRMEELTEVGLQNFFNLFLLLAAVAEIEDVASHVLDLLNFLKPTFTSSQRALIWKGQMAFLLMYTQKNLDIGVLAEKFSSEFREKAKEFLVSKNDEMVQRHTLWTLLSVYIDGVQEVFETSYCLHSSHENLLNDGFSMLLRACRESELRTVLSFLQAVLARVRSIHQQLCRELQRENVDLIVQSSLLAKERHLAAIASALWKHFFSFLKSQRMAPITPLSQLADVAADFTLLAVDIPSTAPSDLQPQPVISIIQLFGWDDIIWPQIVARYLSHLLQNSTLCEALSHSSCVSFQSLTIRSWIRCVLQMHVKNLSGPDDLLIDRNPEQAVEKEYMDQLAEMTRLLLTLSEVKNIFSKAQLEYLPSPEDPKKVLVQFLEAVGITYRTLETLSDRSAMVTKSLEYLGEVLKYIKPYLGKNISSAGLQLTYGIMGILVKSWAQIFATSKAQKLLFRIIDCLLLPHTVLQQEKELPAPMLTAIHKNLPLYLQGICIVCCQSQNSNAYLNQLLRNIIEQYIRRFLPASACISSLGQHPVLLALRDSGSVPAVASLGKHIVHVIRKSYLEFKGSSPPPRLASILAFILQLFKDTHIGVCEVEILLPAILKCLLLVNEPEVKRLATENLECMVKTCQAGSEGETATQLTSLFRQFIQDYGMSYSYQIYSILETVATLNQQVVIHLIPTLTQSLKNSELKWGFGRNIAQREAYSKLLSHLGQVGEDEKQRLESEKV
uniref:Protein MMS22-like n=1 Tax=Nannospalax galili TaxID=1026970 RepID=A0A8C6RGU0_NANGA